VPPLHLYTPVGPRIKSIKDSITFVDRIPTIYPRIIQSTRVWTESISVPGLKLEDIQPEDLKHICPEWPQTAQKAEQERTIQEIEQLRREKLVAKNYAERLVESSQVDSSEEIETEHLKKMRAEKKKTEEELEVIAVKLAEKLKLLELAPSTHSLSNFVHRCVDPMSSDILVEGKIPPYHVSTPLGVFLVKRSANPDLDYSLAVYGKHWVDLLKHLAKGGVNLNHLSVHWDTLRLSEDEDFLSALGSVNVGGKVTLRGVYPTASIHFLRKKMSKHFVGFSSKTIADMSWKVCIHSEAISTLECH
jgi:hypothetical protein